MPVKPDRACIRSFKAADKAQKSTLSASGGTDYAKYLAAFKLKAHAAKSLGFDIIALIDFAEILNA